MLCNRCGKKVNEGRKACSCGASVVLKRITPLDHIQKKRCPKCGQVLGRGGVCANCQPDTLITPVTFDSATTRSTASRAAAARAAKARQNLILMLVGFVSCIVLIVCLSGYLLSRDKAVDIGEDIDTQRIGFQGKPGSGEPEDEIPPSRIFDVTTLLDETTGEKLKVRSVEDAKALMEKIAPTFGADERNGYKAPSKHKNMNGLFYYVFVQTFDNQEISTRKIILVTTEVKENEGGEIIHISGNYEPLGKMLEKTSDAPEESPEEPSDETYTLKNYTDPENPYKIKVDINGEMKKEFEEAFSWLEQKQSAPSSSSTGDEQGESKSGDGEAPSDDGKLVQFLQASYDAKASAVDEKNKVANDAADDDKKAADDAKKKEKSDFCLKLNKLVYGAYLMLNDGSDYKHLYIALERTATHMQNIEQFEITMQIAGFKQSKDYDIVTKELNAICENPPSTEPWLKYDNKQGQRDENGGTNENHSEGDKN